MRTEINPNDYMMKNPYEEKPGLQLYNYVNSVLLPNGFIILINDGMELLAFNPNNNITFYVPDVFLYDRRYYYFQQPAIDQKEGCITLFEYKTLNMYNSKKIEFPVFTDECYLRITQFNISSDLSQFEESMIRMKDFPLLYRAIGEENRNICDSISKQKTLKI